MQIIRLPQKTVQFVNKTEKQMERPKKSGLLGPQEKNALYEKRNMLDPHYHKP